MRMIFYRLSDLPTLPETQRANVHLTGPTGPCDGMYWSRGADPHS